MVNTHNVHPNPFIRQNPDLPWPPPSSEEGKEDTRKIEGKVWLLENFISIATSYLDGTNDRALIAATNDCQADMQENRLTYADLAEIICMLTDRDYQNSMWCMRSAREGVKCAPEASWLPCDAYTIPIRYENNESITYYLKMCQNLTGTVLLLISTHPSNFANT